ncbi:LacI family DNA-binding transcriptional regulator [Pseudarthrobacter sp. O4]|uniref:LacI family DNA-binding transcriptional regulator n=1 Tax=Pseudarthrobacter sp. O4 TaxID=3418417 RepID=UPI003CF0CEC2
MSKVTIHTVAEHAGVSIATVSRALAGSDTVAPELRQAVERSARKLGYVRNNIASALRSSKTRTVGMVVPEIANPFITELVQEVEDALRVRGFQLLLCSAHQDPAGENEALQSLIARQIDGIIISPVNAATSMTAVKAAAATKRLVQVDQRIDGLDAHWIGVDDEQGIRLVLRHLKDQGVNSAGFVSAREADSSSVTRYQAFRQLCGEMGITVAEEHVRLGDYSASFGRRAMTELVEQGGLPDSLVCGADVIAIGALQTCYRTGLKVPDSLLLTGFDDIEFADLCAPRLTTVRQPLRAIARQAVKLLLDDDQETTVRLALAPRLVVRESSMRRPRQNGSADD